MQKKEIKVIMIPDETNIIINYGSDDDNELNVGQEIEIYDPSIKIKDPDTGNVLGFFYLKKDRLIITEIHEKYSIAKKRHYTVLDLNHHFLSSPLLNDLTSTYEKLNVKEEDVLDKSKFCKICIGDKVKLVKA